MKDEIRKLGKDFSETELAPLWESLDCKNPALFDSILKKAALNGIFSFLIEEDLGGSGLRVSDYCVFIEEAARVCAGVAYALASHISGIALLLLTPASEEARSLLACVADPAADAPPPLFAPAIYEHGSHKLFPDYFNTNVSQDGGRIVINGEKENVPCASSAAYFTIVARRAPAGPDVLIAIPASSPGVIIKEEKDKLGLRICPSNDVIFNNVEAPVECIISESSDKSFFRRWREYIDPVYAAVAIGVASEARDVALKYSIGRYQGGKMICDHEAVRTLLTGMEVKLRAARSFAYGPEAGYLSSAFAAEAAEDICLDAIQTLGGYGYISDYKVERMLRDSKTLRASAMARAREMEFIEDEIERLR